MQDPKLALPTLEQRVYTLVEAEREKLDPKARHLELAPELAAVARLHSEAMAKEHALNHAAADGETVATILMARDKDFQGLLGENLAGQYYTPENGIDPDDYAHRFVTSWLDSASHRDNLAFPDYERAGVGAALDGKMIYITVLFAADIRAPAGAKTDTRAPRGVQSYRDAKAAMDDKPVPEPVTLRGSEAAPAGGSHKR